jgi:hypothetical protein
MSAQANVMKNTPAILIAITGCSLIPINANLRRLPANENAR